MPDPGNGIPASPIDLSRFTESTRRAVYDAVVSVHFNPTPEEVRQATADPDNHWVPDYGPDDASLTVFFAFGRWFAVWRSLEEGSEAPEEHRWTVLRVGADPSGGLIFLEV